NKRLINRIAGAVVLTCLALTLVAGAGQGTAPASAAARVTPPSSGTQRQEALVLRVYFRDHAERDRLAVELSAEEVATTGGFLTVITDRNTYNKLLARGLRVEIDQDQTREANDPHLFDSFYGGYKSVEEVSTFLD